MSEIFKNAVTSIILGIEDFNVGTDERMLSAARNYYAGLLLLAKECLVRAASTENAMEIIGAKFKPTLDGKDGVKYEVVGHATVDLAQLRQRFKDFKLSWPNVNIDNLQKLRNELEHFHIKKSASAVGEVIAATFPMIVDFFQILHEDPSKCLNGAWSTIVTRREAFEKVQSSCLDSWKGMNWPVQVDDLDKMSCPACYSSLIGQEDSSNEDHRNLIGKCFQCSKKFSRKEIMEMIVQAIYGRDFLYGEDFCIIDSCPECATNTYVENSKISVCYSCGEEVISNCCICGGRLDINEYNLELSGMCSYCAYKWEKMERE